MYGARIKDQALNLMDYFAPRYQREYPRIVECLLKDRDGLLTFYGYPHEHRQSLKTTYPIESIFSPVRLRTNAPPTGSVDKVTSTRKSRLLELCFILYPLNSGGFPAAGFYARLSITSYLEVFQHSPTVGIITDGDI
jgi:hypothetical protein